jgi:hypothetical protein
MAVYFIGNSHLDQFKLNTVNYVKPIAFLGASIKGLLNHSSKLQINSYIQTIIQKDIKLVFCLGQVDVEFGYYYKCVIDKKKYDIDEYIDNLIKMYELYLKTLSCKIYICCINPTVISNVEHIYKVCFTEKNGKEGGYSDIISNLKFEDIKDSYLNDSFETRWNMNLKFNQKLEIMCKQYNYIFINYWPLLLNNEGNLKNEYKPDFIDHHLRDCGSLELRDFVLSKVL